MSVTITKGDLEPVSSSKSHLMPLLTSGGQPHGAHSCEHSFSDMAPFPRPGACPAKDLLPALSMSPSPATGTVLLPGHCEWITWKKWLPVPFQFCKLFSLATRRFIRKGISKYCVLYCRKTALALNWKSLKNGHQSFDIRRQWSILIWLQLPSGMVCLSFHPLYEGYYRAHHLQQTWLLWTIGYSGQKLISQTKHIKSNTFFIGYNRQKPWFRLTLSRDFNDITIGLQRGKGRMAGIKWGQGTPEVSFPTK